MKTATTVTCPLCGLTFDPAGHIACASCPLQRGCQLVCCPNCGYELVDLHQSKLAGAIMKLFRLMDVSKSPNLTNEAKTRS
jgi:hypothetical protein